MIPYKTLVTAVTLITGVTTVIDVSRVLSVGSKRKPGYDRVGQPAHVRFRRHCGSRVPEPPCLLLTQSGHRSERRGNRVRKSLEPSS
jgi:hypothetical protein